MIGNKKRSVILNEVPIPEYLVVKRVGPSQPLISIDRIQKAFSKSSCEAKSSIIHLTMINIYCESEKQTSLNSLLLPEKNISKKQY